MLRDRGVADPSAGRFARRTSTAPDAARHSLSAAFERIERLPALAEPRDRLLALLRQERAPLGDIVATIESDIALVIGVLRAANVVAARPSSGVATVREAIAVLAPRGLEVLVERIPAVDFFEQRPAWRTPPERFRLHAVAVQVAADRLGRELGHESHEELAVAALLHDVGKLVLVDAYPGYPARVHGTAATAEERIHAERRELGIDHALVGGVLVRRLGLPGRLAAAIERHHANDAEGTAAVVRLADLLAHYGHGRPVDPGALLAAARRVGLSPRALRTVMYELPGGMAARRRAAEPSPLTPKEIAAVRGLSEGKLYKEIAVGLGVTTSTVRSHLHAAYRKMGAADRAQAVLIATERGWL
jgi:putative nucleotidyltransferase with HDIG domain